MWRERISGWTDEVRFHDRASEATIGACEAALGQASPRDLVELLRESDGVDGEYGLGLVWSVDRIRADNLRWRADVTFAGLYMPFDPLLFFADAGTVTSSRSSSVTGPPTWSSGITRQTVARSSRRTWPPIWSGG